MGGAGGPSTSGGGRGGGTGVGARPHTVGRQHALDELMAEEQSDADLLSMCCGGGGGGEG